MTPGTVQQANRSAYMPRTLPAIFDRTAGTGAGLPTASILPDGVIAPQIAPGTLPLRAPPVANPGPYKIGIGDVVQFSTNPTVSNGDDTTGPRTYAVQDDGAINIPSVGRVGIAELTLEQAESALFQRLVETQQDPTFSIEVAEFNARKVSIGGAVAEPTVAPITLTPLYLNEALTLAGGINATDQDYTSVRLYRDGRLYQIPLSELLGRSDLQRIRLIDGDSVYVDTAYELSQAQAYFEQQIALVQIRQEAKETAVLALSAEVDLRRADLAEARENFRTRSNLNAEARDYVYLMGEVANQSRYPLPYEQRASLADAIFDAGNGIPLETGDVSQIYVLRATDDGAINAWRLDGTNAVNFTLATKFELRPDDLIFVAERPVTRWGRTIRQLTAPWVSGSITRSVD